MSLELILHSFVLHVIFFFIFLVFILYENRKEVKRFRFETLLSAVFLLLLAMAIFVCPQRLDFKEITTMFMSTIAGMYLMFWSSREFPGMYKMFLTLVFVTSFTYAVVFSEFFCFLGGVVCGAIIISAVSIVTE